MNSATFLPAFLVAMTTALAPINSAGCEAGSGGAERRATESRGTPKTKSARSHASFPVSELR